MMGKLSKKIRHQTFQECNCSKNKCISTFMKLVYRISIFWKFFEIPHYFQRMQTRNCKCHFDIFGAKIQIFENIRKCLTQSFEFLCQNIAKISNVFEFLRQFSNIYLHTFFWKNKRSRVSKWDTFDDFQTLWYDSKLIIPVAVRLSISRRLSHRKTSRKTLNNAEKRNSDARRDDGLSDASRRIQTYSHP